MNAVIPVDGLKFTKGSKQELSVYKDTETTSGNPMERVSSLVPSDKLASGGLYSDLISASYQFFCGSCGSAIQSVPKDSPIAYFKVSSVLNRPLNKLTYEHLP